MGINLAACLKARRLIEALDSLRPNDPVASFFFLLAKTKEGALGATLAAGPTCFTDDL